MQTALAGRLSEIITHVPDEVSQLYFKAFVKTMRREWFGIDRHRMDKFLMLIRKFYAQHLRYLQSKQWYVHLTVRVPLPLFFSLSSQPTVTPPPHP